MRLTLASLAALALLAGCSSGNGSRTSATLPDSSVVVPAEASSVLARAQNGSAAVTVLNVWATWCGPCREEFPAMLAAIERHSPDARLLLYSADFDDQAPAVRKFLAERGVRDTVYLKSGDDSEFIRTLHPDWSGALPATLVFDREGTLRSFWEGEADSARFETAIQAALAHSGR